MVGAQHGGRRLVLFQRGFESALPLHGLSQQQQRLAPLPLAFVYLRQGQVRLIKAGIEVEGSPAFTLSSREVAILEEELTELTVGVRIFGINLAQPCEQLSGTVTLPKAQVDNGKVTIEPDSFD